MDAGRYFDHAATTPLDPRVLEEMLPFLAGEFGNAHSQHGWGRRAREAVEQARGRIAEAIGADDPMQVLFTSGATEANNWVLSLVSPSEFSPSEVFSAVISPFEHNSLREPAEARGAQVLEADGWDLRPPAAGAALVFVIGLHNETGRRWDVRRIAPTAGRVHADLTQALGKEEVSVQGLDFASFSAHKVGGPKGVGALFSSEGPVAPFLQGGGQEHGARSGTLNVAGIVGFGLAALLAAEEHAERARNAANCRAEVMDTLTEREGWMDLSGPEASPFILALAREDVLGEALVLETDVAGYAISSGSACSSESTEVSPSLRAAGIPEDRARGLVRISFGAGSDPSVARDLALKLHTIAKNLRTMR